MRLTLLTILFAGICSATHIPRFTTISWSGPSNFESATMLFDEVEAQALVFDAGGAYFHLHGPDNATAVFEILIGGDWFTVSGISSQPGEFNIDRSLDEFGDVDSFLPRRISGVRFFTIHGSGGEFHGLSNATTFTLDRGTPEPSTFALLGIGGLGLVVWRRRGLQTKA